mgnify:CR=1 FL=1
MQQYQNISLNLHELLYYFVNHYFCKISCDIEGNSDEGGISIDAKSYGI